MLQILQSLKKTIAGAAAMDSHQPRRLLQLAGLCSALLIGPAACNSNASRPVATEAEIPPALILTDHPLANRIYDVRAGRFITEDTLYRRLTRAGYILIGETHDNTAQHRVETAIVDYLAGLHRPASVSFEMIDNQQGRLLQGRKIKSSAELIELLKQTDSGWDYEIYYRNLFDSVIRAGFSILPANIERTLLVGLMNRHAVEVPADLQRLLSATQLSDRAMDAMLKDIMDSHCGMLKPEQARPMVTGQRLRDAAMAASLLQSTAELKVLIAGNGHVRTDLGVPRYIHTANSPLIAIGVLEVEEDNDKPTDYAADWNSDKLPFDYVWFTARANRVDPCIDFIRTHSPNK